MPENILRLIELILIAVCITEIVVLLKYVKLIKVVWEDGEHYILFLFCFFFVFFFNKSILYKNIQAEISGILRIW